MIYTIQLSIRDLCEFDLATIDIPKDEQKNTEDAFKCEMEYNGFDMII